MLLLLWKPVCLGALKVTHNSTGALGKLITTEFPEEIDLTILFLLCPTLLLICCLMGPVRSVATWEWNVSNRKCCIILFAVFSASSGSIALKLLIRHVFIVLM